MQITIYFTDEDEWLINEIDAMASSQRKSRSSMILSIIEQFFLSEGKVGDILVSMGKITSEQLAKALELQKKSDSKRFLGQILVDEGFIEYKDILRVLAVQDKE